MANNGSSHVISTLAELEALYPEAVYPPAKFKETDRITKAYRALVEASPALLDSPAGRLVHGQALVDQGLSDEALADVDTLVDHVGGGLYSVQALVISALVAPTMSVSPFGLVPTTRTYAGPRTAPGLMVPLTAPAASVVNVVCAGWSGWKNGVTTP